MAIAIPASWSIPAIMFRGPFHLHMHSCIYMHRLQDNSLWCLLNEYSIGKPVLSVFYTRMCIWFMHDLYSDFHYKKKCYICLVTSSQVKITRLRICLSYWGDLWEFFKNIAYACNHSYFSLTTISGSASYIWNVF